LGQYHIVREIGRGGMAVVYRAYQPALDRYVAVKVLPQELAFDQQFVERFQREAKAVARLNHPHIVTVHDVGQDKGLYFIVMEYVDGPSLTQLLDQQGTLSPEQATRIVSQVSWALDYAHRQGFVHRDIKPGNILLGPEGTAKLTDFGIVKAAEGTRLTETGTLLGTPEYMSPEQAAGREIGRGTDVYSLGVVAYEMLSGRVPFAGETMAVLHAHVYDPPDLSVLPRGARRVVGKALAKDPRKRHASAGALAQALEAAFEENSASPAPLRKWAWAIGAVGAAFVAAVALTVIAFVNLPRFLPTTPTSRVPAVALEATDTLPPPGPTETATLIPSATPSAEPTDAPTTAPPPSPPPTEPIPSPTSPPIAPPQTQRIAFVRVDQDTDNDGGLDWNDRRGIYVMSATGADLQRLTSQSADAYSPAWSPDGQRLAYACRQGGDWEICVMDAGGANLRTLTSNVVDDEGPSWSPDGYRIAFHSTRHGNDEIYVMGADGSNVVRLTQHAAEDKYPVWSPDGQMIAFHSDRDGNQEVYVMNRDGTGQTNLTQHSGDDWWPAWSPDGGTIAFVCMRYGVAEICLVDLNTRAVTRLTHSTAGCASPAWSPDGSRVAFARWETSKNCEIYCVDRDGQNLQRLTNHVGLDTRPAWSP
jgi:serine/threonine protein kinase